MAERAWCSRGSAVRVGDDGVLSEIHVSCYVTAANRATPVLEVLPERNCVRVINKPGSENSSSMSTSIASGGNTGLSVEWEFHSVFSSSSISHAADFFNEITLPALRTSRDGINANIVVWGVHPTQKFRLLFGKSVGGAGGVLAPQPEMEMNDVVEMHGQLAGIFHAFFSDKGSGDGNWRLGISSWIIVNNQAFDLLNAPTGGSPVEILKPPSTEAPISFVSLEATSLESAFRIMQTAKTNRIVRKHNAESAHFFVRLALFHCGQVSTVHLVDLIDQKEFLDHTSTQEKHELYNILHDLRQPSRRNSNPWTGSTPGKMMLSNFMAPILTANAKTFFYANVIDSRTSLGESVQMLNAVANLRGLTSVCKRLRGVSFEQLGFQSSPGDRDLATSGRYTRQTVANGPTSNNCLLSRVTSSSSLNGFQAGNSTPPALTRNCDSKLPRQQSAPCSSQVDSEPDAMSWLTAFTQRKRDILGGSIDTVSACMPTPSRTADTSLAESEDAHQNVTPESRPSIADLYDRLRESLDGVDALVPPKVRSPRASFCSAHCLSPSRSVAVHHRPLPIIDQGCYDHEELESNLKTSKSQPQKQDFEDEDDNDLSVWDQTNNTALDRSAERFPPQYRGPNKRPPSSQSEAEFAELVTSPLSSPISPAQPMPSTSTIQTLKAFKKAGLPASMMSPPNLDGLDVKTAQKIQAADATLLRKNYDALLSIVREQQQAKEAAEASAVEALHDQEELRAMFEVQIENMKLANVALRSKVRALESRTALPQVFEQYEQELRNLQTQVQQLQERNVALELRTSGADGGDGMPKANIGGSVDIKKKYQRVVEEKSALEREVMEFRRKERHLQVSSRLAGESTRRVDQLSRDLNNKEEDLVAARLSKQRLNAEMNQALEKADQLHQENEQLLQEKAATTEELLATRMYLASLENEKKKATILDRFVEKHGDRMNKLRQQDSSSGNRGQSWRRDEYARECEDKLLAAVKRSLPQAVPLCNKLLRRLEIQELSLREFSEREIDFINMLVELVSDQPTVSLKQMIEQEMQKLQS